MSSVELLQKSQWQLGMDQNLKGENAKVGQLYEGQHNL